MDFQMFVGDALERASKIATNNFGKVSGVVKASDNNQVLTETDLEIGQLIIKNIKEAYPEHNIIDEEAGVINNNSEYTWVVDPIDGTSNFARGTSLYGIFLGLLKGSVPVVGGIALPSFNQIYLAEKGMGASCNGKRLRISDEVKLSNSLIAYGIDGHHEKSEITEEECAVLAKIILKVRNLRSSNSAYDAAMVAGGKYEAYLNRTSKIWDNVAQQVVLEEAGAVYTDFWGKPMDYSDPLARVGSNFTFCVAGSEIHKQIQDIVGG